MMVSEHVTEFAGRPAQDWEPGQPLAEPGATAWRIALDWDEGEEGQTWTDKFAEFLGTPGVERVEALIVGPWDDVVQGGSVDSVVEALVNARDRLPHLAALFLGDIISEESEISWIRQGDVSPLFEAYPALEYFAVRGGNGLDLGHPQLENLRSLVIESGGLGREVVAQVLEAELPVLEHLELWLGSDNYGADTTVEDLRPLLARDVFPHLTSLGLRDAEIADEIAQALGDAPFFAHVKTLDLSLGNLSDVGAEALLANPAVARLEQLDLHHHYCSDAVMTRLAALGPQVNLDEQEEPDEYDGEAYRYVAVGE